MKAFITIIIACVTNAIALADVGSRQATGVKVGEVTDTTAIIWTRLTAESGRKAEGITFNGPDRHQVGEGKPVESFEGECPGADGEVRLRYGQRDDLDDAVETEWVTVASRHDFIHQFKLTGLAPDTRYYFKVETRSPDTDTRHAALDGQFKTAPPPNLLQPVLFTAMTCQAYRDKDRPDGFQIYESMKKLKPDFGLTIGDIVYYDNDPPDAKGVPLARYHWHRMYSLDTLVQFHREVPNYWLKDDHDTLINDCWPTMDPGKMAPLTFADGLRIFREQVPMSELTYRTFRWGKGLQLWLVEGRDYRSPNDMKDGPAKTIWGKEQKDWLKKTLLESDAAWKVLISPTPIVGPDRESKADNHANKAFAHEGNELREWFQKHLPENFFIICGDRHWQYHSVHPETGVHEFSCGAASDEHAGGSPGSDAGYRFHRMKGGFLSGGVLDGPHINGSRFFIRHHDVNGKVVNAFHVDRVQD